MTLASDVPYTVAYVAEKLGLPGIGTASAMLASEKILMKNCFLEHAVPMPAYREAHDANDLQAFAEEHGLPVVVKPVDSRGARGVQLIQTLEDLRPSFDTARQYSPTGRVMIESYLSGPQLSTEGFMIDGEACIPSIFDRNYERLQMYAPFIVEDGGEMPSIYSEQFRNEVNQVMKQAALALGITTGVIKGDLVIHDGKVKVIELAARMSGGFFGTLAAPVSNGVDLIAANIRIALGEKVSGADLQPDRSSAAAIRFAFPPTGTIQSIGGIEQVQADPACRYAHVFAHPGDVIAPITNHPGRPAVVVAEGRTAAEAAAHASRLIQTLTWSMH
jgi:biotin carboxylase